MSRPRQSVYLPVSIWSRIFPFKYMFLVMDIYRKSWRRNGIDSLVHEEYARSSAIARRRRAGRIRAWNWLTAIGMISAAIERALKGVEGAFVRSPLSGLPRPITRKPRA